ncbi:MAG: DUF3786 domain-containing protein [Anaerolineae bacterium]|jgi:hypothetical protein
MQAKPRTPEETYGPALEKAKQAFPHLDPSETAIRAAVSYEDGIYRLPFFGTTYHVHWPDGTILRASDQREADVASRILMMHYLLTADGTPLGADWIAFRNLPGGLGYDGAFQGRASLRLAHAFGTDLSGFEKAARALGGERLSFGDASFSFRLLPRVWLAAVLHLADEEFSATANVLFDAAASHYLPTEDLAVLGGILASQLIKAARTGL